MIDKFGPRRNEHNEYPSVYFSNAFIGNILRLDLLAKANKKEQIKQEVQEYFLHMARTIGTLWEFMAPEASCNHCFASVIACWMD